MKAEDSHKMSDEEIKVESDRLRRHLFDPQKGWVRRLERNASLVLARHIYPSIPLISRAVSLTETAI